MVARAEAHRVLIFFLDFVDFLGSLDFLVFLGFSGYSFQFPKGRAGVWSVKYRRPYYQPVTSRAYDVGGIIQHYATINLSRKIQP